MTNEAEIAQARSNLYHWFSYLFRFEPTLENMEPFFEPNVQQLLTELLSAFKSGDKLLEVIRGWENDESMLSNLRSDYQNLFKIPGNKYLLPYESCYREKFKDNSPGLIFGKSTLEVAGLYRVAGIKIDKDELPDFFGNELFFMAQLAEIEVEMWKQDQKDIAKRYQKWQEGFLNDHLLKWSDEFLNKMHLQAETIFYQSIAQIVNEFLAEDVSYLVSEQTVLN